MQRGTQRREAVGPPSQPCTNCSGRGTVTFRDHDGLRVMPCPFCDPKGAREAARIFDPPVPLEAPEPIPVDETFAAAMRELEALKQGD